MFSGFLFVWEKFERRFGQVSNLLLYKDYKSIINLYELSLVEPLELQSRVYYLGNLDIWLLQKLFIENCNTPK